MNIFQRIGNRLGLTKKPAGEIMQRGYREVASVGGGINADWALSYLSEDSDVWQNSYALTSRVRDLFRTNPLYQSYRETLWANVYGSEGIQMRSQVKEQEDRVIHSKDEERAISDHDAREERVFKFFATQQGQEYIHKARLIVTGANGSRVAEVKVGEPDVFARIQIEAAWMDWQRPEFCDARQTRSYNTLRQLRLISAVRDGDFFIRMVQGRSVNKYGFTLQLINAEWVDRFFNMTLSNGNVVIMGIEYQFTSFGLGKPVAYYFIKRHPMDWQFSIPSAFNYSAGMHDRISADEIIHYARPVNADSTRPSPWVASCIPSSRQHNEAMIAEVVAWRQSACKTGYLYSDIQPEGGMAGVQIDPKNSLPSQPLGPGDIGALQYGVKYQSVDPTHPNTAVKDFRQAVIQDITSGMPGANYSTMANDYAAINFSAGRLQRLDSNENYKIIQSWDIERAETRIFETFLRCALTFGAIPLPLAKFDKLNKKVFQGRRWGGVDEVKEVTAAALRVANHFSSDQRECAAMGLDFRQVLFEQAEANMLKMELGMGTAKTVESPQPQQNDTSDQQVSDEDDQPPQAQEEDDDEHDPTVKSRW